jgi:hypothetical protein
MLLFCVVPVCLQLSVLSPSWDNFTLQTLRDHLPQQLCNLPGTQRCALHVSQLWAGALAVMALVGLVGNTQRRIGSRS